jgi:hypothetical protein
MQAKLVTKQENLTVFCLNLATLKIGSEIVICINILFYFQLSSSGWPLSELVRTFSS